MTDGIKELIRYKLDRARETLDEAGVMLDSGHIHGAANRVYYACFYAVTALLLTRNLSSSRHRGVISLFNQHFVKTGLVPVDMGKFYSRVFDNRLDSDYADWTVVDEQDINDTLREAQEFIGTIASLINRQLS